MDHTLVTILQQNTYVVQKKFYDRLKTEPSPCDNPGFVFGAYSLTERKETGLVKIGWTQADPFISAEKMNCKLIFCQKTEHTKKCNRLLHLLFDYIKVIKYDKNQNKNVEWFNISNIMFNTLVNINNVPQIVTNIANLITNKNNHYIQDNQNNHDNEEDNIKDDPIVDNNEDADFSILGGALIGGLLVGGFAMGIAAITDANSDIKEGINDDIFKYLEFLEGEKTVYYYHKDKIYIVLTNKRFIKIENNKLVSESYLNNIKDIRHKKGGMFHYDKIEIIEHNKKIETFGIYNGSICIQFINLIKNIINMD